MADDNETSPAPVGPAVAERVQITGTMHDAFQRSIELMLADREVSPEERERILANVSCPCCGGMFASFTMKLGRK